MLCVWVFTMQTVRVTKVCKIESLPALTTSYGCVGKDELEASTVCFTDREMYLVGDDLVV